MAVGLVGKSRTIPVSSLLYLCSEVELRNIIANGPFGRIPRRLANIEDVQNISVMELRVKQTCSSVQ